MLFRADFTVTGLRLAPRGDADAPDYPLVFDYGDLRVDLEKRGIVIGPLDMLIAAHALRLGATLVTANFREFRRVADLQCLEWKQ